MLALNLGVVSLSSHICHLKCSFCKVGGDNWFCNLGLTFVPSLRLSRFDPILDCHFNS